MLESVIVKLDKSVARLTFNVPETGNRLDNHSVERLYDHLVAADSDPDIRAIVLSGAGEDFCAGRRMSAANKVAGSETALEHQKEHDAAFHVCAVIRKIDTPVIAKVRGKAHGLGLALAAAADVTVASTNADFAIPEMARGVLPTISMASLVDRMPVKALIYRSLMAASFTAQEACQQGIVSVVTDDDDLENACENVVNQLLMASADAVSALKNYALTAQAIDSDKATAYARALHAMINSSLPA